MTILCDNSMQERFEAMRFLVAQGTEKKITLQYCGTLHGLTEREYLTKSVKPKHRAGTHWLKGEYRYIADRAIRLFIDTLGFDKLNHRITASEFKKYSEIYFTVYPCDDEVSTNRLHYMINSIREHKALYHEACDKCNKPFVTHIDDYMKKSCHICEH